MFRVRGRPDRRGAHLAGRVKGILADQSTAAQIVHGLRDAGFDVVWIQEQSPGSSDDEVYTMAAADRRVLLAQDKDFGLIAQRRRSHPPSIVLARLASLPPSHAATTLVESLQSLDEWEGSLVVVEPGRIRKRAPRSRLKEK